MLIRLIITGLSTYIRIIYMLIILEYAKIFIKLNICKKHAKYKLYHFYHNNTNR